MATEKIHSALRALVAAITEEAAGMAGSRLTVDGKVSIVKNASLYYLTAPKLTLTLLGDTLDLTWRDCLVPAELEKQNGLLPEPS